MSQLHFRALVLGLYPVEEKNTECFQNTSSKGSNNMVFEKSQSNDKLFSKVSSSYHME